MTLPGPPSPSTFTATKKSAQALSKASPEQLTFHILSADTAWAHSLVITQSATILTVGKCTLMDDGKFLQTYNGLWVFIGCVHLFIGAREFRSSQVSA
jgi:hypothetical protein